MSGFNPIWYFYIKESFMITFPPAKINLGLRITGKRDDGYHDLQTIFYPVCLCDALEYIEPEEQLKEDILVVTGNIDPFPQEDNITIKALGIMRRKRSIPHLRIHLHKAIPVGAGLGGGSSDASAFIKSLNRFFNLDLTSDELLSIAAETGSDCPFFIFGTPAYATGRGEILTPAEPVNGDWWLLLVGPDIHVSTAEAYRGCEPYKSDTDLISIFNSGVENWKGNMVNDFEKSVFKRYPLLGEIKEMIYNSGAIYASMSGSGSSIYGLFREKPDIPAALADMIVYSGNL